MTFYGTTDGKLFDAPVVWRIPTDDDAKKRPVCRVRDSEKQDWAADKNLLAVLQDNSSPFIVSRGFDDGFTSVGRYKFCEIIDDTKTEPAA
jgi:hypothetical protein